TRNMLAVAPTLVTVGLAVLVNAVTNSMRLPDSLTLLVWVLIVVLAAADVRLREQRLERGSGRVMPFARSAGPSNVLVVVRRKTMTVHRASVRRLFRRRTVVLVVVLGALLPGVAGTLLLASGNTPSSPP